MPASATHSQAAATREMQLLLASLGPASPEADCALQNLFAESEAIDWPALLQSILWHDVTVLVVRRLRSSGCSGLLPKELAAQLQQTVTRQTVRSMMQAAALDEIQKASEESGIRCLAWKGPALSALLYGDFTVRNAYDLDFLVHRRQLRAMEDLLIAKGFKADAISTSDAVTTRFRDFFCEVKLSREQLHVELHDEIMPRAYLRGQSMQDCLDRSTWQSLGPSAQVRTLAPDDLLLSLCLHGSKHQWEKLKWLCDIASFLERYADTTDWPRLIRQAHMVNAIRPLLNGMLLCHRVLGSSLPAAILEAAAQDNGLKALIGTQEAWLKSGMRRHEQKLLKTVSATHLLARRRDRAAYMMRKLILITPFDVARVRLPQGLSFLYYPLRWIRLGRKGCRELTQVAIRYAGQGSKLWGR